MGPVATVSCCGSQESCLMVPSSLLFKKNLEGMVNDNRVQCFLIASWEGVHIGMPETENQCVDEALMSLTVVRVFRRICDWRGTLPAAEAKKADDACMGTLRITRPPDHTGKTSPSPLVIS